MKYIIISLIFGIFNAQATDEAARVSRWLQYQSLPRITKEKIDMKLTTSTDCRDPHLKYGPHLKPGIHIYANELAIASRKKNPDSHQLPIGALLIKEKFERKEDVQPSTITVMEKVADQGKVDDWQFYMIRLSDRSIIKEGFKVSCIDCHATYAKTGFVSRETDFLLSEFVKRKKLR